MERIHVLCVDDNADVLAVLRTLIDRAEGLACVGTLETAKNLAEEVAGRRADVVLLDLGIPDCDTFAEIRKLAGTGADTKVIVITGHSDEQTVEETMAAGAAACLTKGVAPRVIVEAIRQAGARDSRGHAPGRDGNARASY